MGQNETRSMSCNLSDYDCRGKYCVKHGNFTQFSCVENLWNDTVPPKFRAICSKLRGKCAFPQNFNTSKLPGESYGILRSFFCIAFSRRS